MLVMRHPNRWWIGASQRMKKNKQIDPVFIEEL